MDWQNLFNLVLGVALPVGGWFCRQLWDSVKDLKTDIVELRLHVAESCVKKTEMESQYGKIEAMLEKIFDKLDKKVDK
jgi:hypothetical protein